MTLVPAARVAEAISLSKVPTTADSVTLRADGDISQFLGSTITTSVFNGFVDQDGATDASGGVATLSGVTSGVANLTGNANDDSLTGNGNINTLNGGAGSDILTAPAGNDFLIGGVGADTLDGGASYANATAGVIASLFSSAANTGDAAGDTFASIEGLIGSAFDDRLCTIRRETNTRTKIEQRFGHSKENVLVEVSCRLVARHLSGAGLLPNGASDLTWLKRKSLPREEVRQAS